MEANTQVTKGVKWDEYDVRQYVKALREQQKEDPSPAILRSKINDLVCELYLDGYTCPEIASLLSLSHSTPYRVLMQRGVYKKPEAIVTPKIEKKVVSMYRHGRSLKEIVEQTNISKASVRRIIIKNNVPCRRKIKPDEHALKKGIEMYKEGFTMQDIVIATNLRSSYHLYIALRESGIPMREGCRGNTQKKKEAQERAIHLYRKTKLTLSEILKETGVSVKTFRKLLAQREIPLRPPLGAAEEQKEEAVRLYQQGLSLADIRQKTGVHSGTLGILLKNRGIPLRIKNEFLQKMKEEAVRLYQQGATIKEIEEKTGIRRTALGNIRKEKNVPQDRKHLVGQKIEQHIVRLVKQGKTTKEIAARTGVKVATINAIRKRYDVPGDRRLRDEEKERALRMYRQGDSMIEIERRTRVHRLALIALLKERNISVTIKKKIKNMSKGG